MGNQEEAAAQQNAAGEPKRPFTQDVAHEAGDSVWDRIKRHKVVEWSLAYIAFGYAALHGSQMLRETFEWPLAVPRFTFFALLLGLPFAVTLAWYHGHRAQHRVSRTEISILVALLVIAGTALWVVSRSSHQRGVSAAQEIAARTSADPADTTFAPPPHSLAVLPFVNMSGDKDQEYFSDGLSEELLSSLSRINELQVAARTSSFYFKGEHADLLTIAHKLNVASVLEGSVRRSGHTIRVSAQLNSATTGFHLWSQTYDRQLSDVLQLQTEIANSVAHALKITLLGELAQKIEVGGTRNPDAFDAYLRASKAYGTSQDERESQAVIATYTEAIGLDPNYALAFAGRSRALSYDAIEYAKGATAARATIEKARIDARQAIELAPDLAQGHNALAISYERLIDFNHALEEHERAMSLAPGDAQILRTYGLFAVMMGRADVGLAAARHAVSLDPLNHLAAGSLATALYWARRYEEAIGAFRDALAFDPQDAEYNALRGLAYYALGDFQSARASCEVNTDHWWNQTCLAMTYEKLGRHADGEAMLAKMKSSGGMLKPINTRRSMRNGAIPTRAWDGLKRPCAYMMRDSYFSKSIRYSIRCARSRASRRSSGR